MEIRIKNWVAEISIPSYIITIIILALNPECLKSYDKLMKRVE